MFRSDHPAFRFLLSVCFILLGSDLSAQQLEDLRCELTPDSSKIQISGRIAGDLLIIGRDGRGNTVLADYQPRPMPAYNGLFPISRNAGVVEITFTSGNQVERRTVCIRPCAHR